jgi:hypothetical protein
MRRCRLQHTICSICCLDEALKAAGAELDVETIQGVVKRKRERNKNKQKPRHGRGLGKPHELALPSLRPRLKVVGDYLFIPSTGTCTQLKTTIKLLVLENMPGPYRSYNLFSVQAKLNILRKFLQRYTWGPKEDIKRCLNVYENIAADVYDRELHEKRSDCKKLYREDKEEWKKHRASWCRNVEYWSSLCDIWSKQKWEQISSTNRENQSKEGPVIHHVGGSRSMYQHMQSLV